jgi:iron only hydrogenase large subunit-like protein
MKNESYFHSIRISEEKCLGCTHCMRVCPTEGIRLRKGKAYIQDLKCIDCGECLRTCPHSAITSEVDLCNLLANFDYKILILPSSFASLDFKGIPYEIVLKRLFYSGFNEIWEEGIGNEIFLLKTRELLRKRKEKKPIISTACPSIVRFLQVNFPSLLYFLSPLNAPKDILASFIREERENYKKLGIFYASPCPAKVTSVKNPQGIRKSQFDDVFGTNNLYNKVLSIREMGEGKIYLSGRVGLSMGEKGGEKNFLKNYKVISISGVQEAKNFFEKLEEEKIPPVDYIETWSCANGCVGGSLLPSEDTNIASFRLESERKKRFNKFSKDVDTIKIYKSIKEEILFLSEEIKPRPQYFLSEKFEEAAKIMNETEKILKKLPQIDCGSCGAPSCRAFAEDVAKGEATLSECIFYKNKR